MPTSKLLELIRDIIGIPNAKQQEALEAIKALKMYYDHGTRQYTTKEWNKGLIPERQFGSGLFTCRPILKQYFEYEKQLIDMGGIVEAEGVEADNIREKMDELFMQLNESELAWIDQPIKNEE